MTKKKYAVLWKQGEKMGITLHLPVMGLSFEDGKTSSGFEKVKDVKLPEPMTSNQFNKFIKTNEGKVWSEDQVQGELE